MAIDGKCATRHKINGSLGLVWLHHCEIQDHRLALAQRLNRPGHLIEAAGLHQVHLCRCSTDPWHANHVGPWQVSTQVEGVAVPQGGQRPTVSLRGTLVLILLLILVGEIIEFTIEIVVTSDNCTKAGDSDTLKSSWAETWLNNHVPGYRFSPRGF